jgi:uncharacterized protein (TIGR02453 family)
VATYFTKDLFTFLQELEQNNNRDWFHENKPRFESLVKEPIAAFLSDLSTKLEEGYEVSPKALLRQHRDTRFSKDKSPYKTTVACFMHSTGMKKSDHPHGYYLHLSTDESFFGAGVHSPPTPNIIKIRSRIVDHPEEWAPISKLILAGESLKRPPKGFDPENQFIDDLKRKDFIVSGKITNRDVTSADFLEVYLDHCRTARPLMDFLGRALG